MYTNIRAMLTVAALTAVIGGALAACGGDREGGTADTTGAGSAATTVDTVTRVPSWMTVDSAARTVRADIAAGSTALNNHWNFNGYVNGNATITVPQGYTVTINFTNRDQLSPHSLVILSQVGGYPPTFDSLEPAFEGAASPNPTDMSNATMPGATHVVTFTASAAGDYAMVCVLPAHAVTGMWVRFKVSTDGSAGVRNNPA